MLTGTSQADESPAIVADRPRVAVIVPAYGVAHMLGEALESLQKQSLQAWECVVIDDGAPDDVAGAVEPFLADPRIRFISTPNRGVSAARNTAIAATSAPLIALLDGDDLFRPTYLERMVAAMEEEPDICLATCNAWLFGAVAREHLIIEDHEPQETYAKLADVLTRDFNVYIGSMFRRTDFEAISGFDETMRHAEDLDLWVRLMIHGGTARYVDAVLGDYRVRANSASSNGQMMMLGNIRVYEKALAALGDRPEAEIARQLLQENRKALAFEQAIDRIIAGETRQGLRELRALGLRGTSAIWKLAFTSWQVFPKLARPMLTLRRAAHARGGKGRSALFFLGKKAA